MKKLGVILAFFYVAHFQAQFAIQKDFEKYKGFFDFYYDKENDKIYLEVKELEKDFLYVYSLSNGIGSNDIGLDRGQLGNEQVVQFKKAGNKLLLIQPNLKYRALTSNVLEKKSVEQAFARSVLYGFPIKSSQKGVYIVDITDFLMEDMHGVSKRLAERKQGVYSFDKSKSALWLERTKAFPENVEFEALQTFKGEAKGIYIKEVAPNAGLISIVAHHSFIKLPDDEYEPRVYDPRSGSYPFSYFDYATPVNQPIEKKFITRHRLKKKNPQEAVSEAVEPIIYYLDNGTPEPVRSALLEGGRWWNQAFEAIGYKNAFQVKMLPDDVDPLDVRYNVIQWVHRSTRGWSYGASITDPRTGEIIKGHVSLGSLRIRQDFLIAQALMNRPFQESDSNDKAMLDLAIARIRQLSAHEIGHTLGFAHNFASSINNRASVMDYPHPKFKLLDGVVDFSEAYATGIGAWDKVAVAYSYQDFSDMKEEKNALHEILEAASTKGLRYISDQDARPVGSAHIYAHLWDNGTNTAEELNRILKVREAAIAYFSEDNIRSYEPFSVLEDVFVPLYFLHRYQTEAAVKIIGGLDYNYAIKDGGAFTVKPADNALQREALASVLETLASKTLAIPADKLALFPPRAFGYGRTRESFKGKTGVSFDALSVAETASSLALQFLLHPQRASRLIQQHAMDEKMLSLEQVIDELLKNTLKKKLSAGYNGEIEKIVNYNVLKHIMQLGASKQTLPQVDALVNFEMMKLKTWLGSRSIDPYTTFLIKEIDKYLGNPKAYTLPKSPKVPDGSPIGMACFVN
ncbi:zinc-dependent metalloprotease [Ascidiimonas sp. W6]|uniref:zinc-dependent metalloprotease n=1 Tax=Ascidiimonas meishanensis TaxID=3128903 RepID=UPI0030EB1C23